MTTTKPSVLQRLLAKYGACEEAREWCRAYETPAAAWEACSNPEWMLWALDAIGLLTDQDARLFACWCVRETPLADGRKVWDLLTDERSRKAVEVAERFAVGEATEEEMAAAWAAVWATAGSTAGAAAWAAVWATAGGAAGAAARATAGATAGDSAGAAAGAAAGATAGGAAGAAAMAAAGAAQCTEIRRRWGNPFRGEKKVAALLRRKGGAA
jgi:hypothetical protein